VKSIIISIIACIFIVAPIFAQENIVQYTRIYKDDNGVTHFKDDKFFLYSDYHSGVETVVQTPLQRVAGFYLTRTIEGWSVEKTETKRKHYTIILKGEMEIIAGDGEKRTFKTGDILLLEDMKSEGHGAKNIGKVKLLTLNIALPL